MLRKYACYNSLIIKDKNIVIIFWVLYLKWNTWKYEKSAYWKYNGTHILHNITPSYMSLNITTTTNNIGNPKGIQLCVFFEATQVSSDFSNIEALNTYRSRNTNSSNHLFLLPKLGHSTANKVVNFVRWHSTIRHCWQWSNESELPKIFSFKLIENRLHQEGTTSNTLYKISRVVAA